MSTIEIISLIVTIVCLISFCLVFTFLFRHYYKNNIDKVNKGEEDLDLIDLAVIEEEEKKHKGKKAFKITLKVFGYILLGVVIIGFGISLYSRISGNVMGFGNSSLIVIATGSMSEQNSDNTYLKENNLNNQFDAYDVIGLSKYNDVESELKIYDVIAFKGKDGNTYVHRVKGINSDGTLVTRGDSNNLDDNGRIYDGNLSLSDVIGYYNGVRIRGVGIFVIFLQSNSGIITVIGIVYCLIMFDRYKNKYDNAVEERSEMLIKELNYDLNTDVEASKKMVNQYQKILYYQGYKYVFINGEFKDKIKLEESELEEFNQSMMAIYTQENKDSKDASLMINDVDNKETTIIKEEKKSIFTKLKESIVKPKENVDGFNNDSKEDDKKEKKKRKKYVDIEDLMFDDSKEDEK